MNLQGTSSADFVSIEDNDATPGNPITLGPGSTKEANTPGWFAAALVPGLSLLGLAVLVGVVQLAGRRTLRKPASQPI